MNAIVRNGSILYGPRLLLALICVTLLFLVLHRPGGSPKIVPASFSHVYSSQPPPGGSLQNALDGPDALGDKLFEYIKGHAPQTLQPGNPRPDAGGDGGRTTKTFGSSSDKGTEKGNPTSDDLMLDKSLVPVGADFDADLVGEDPAKGNDPLCDHTNDLSDLLVVVRAHAHELYGNETTALMSTLKCVDHLLFSTVAHDFGGPVGESIDALANVSPAIKGTRREFELYRNITLAAESNPDPASIKEDGDHNLGKFTMVPTVLEAYARHPKKKWFMFIEAKTYLSVPNLVAWTAKMNPEQAIFAGAQVYIGDVELPHSGSGILISAAAMEKLKIRSATNGTMWEEMVAQSCCGDKILAQAMVAAGVEKMHHSFPVIQGETPFSLDWSKRHWCKAAITWHGIEAAQVPMLNAADRKWYAKNQQAARDKNSSPISLKTLPPLRYGQLFKALLLPEIREKQNRTQWDNLSSSYTYTDENKGQYAQYSAQACRAACDLRTECLQYAFNPGRCRLGTLLRYGRAGEGEDQKEMTSGWLIKRVELWVKAQDRACVSEGVGAWELP